MTLQESRMLQELAPPNKLTTKPLVNSALSTQERSGRKKDTFETIKLEAISLKTMQTWFMQQITSGNTAPNQENMFKAGAAISAQECLAIYQRSYILRLRECLAEQYRATQHALGHSLFNAFADEYLRDYPSQSYTLFELGKHFPRWLHDNRPDRNLPAAEQESWIDFMEDLADYELTLFELFDSPGTEQDASPSTPANTPDQELTISPNLRLRQYRFAVAGYYQQAYNPEKAKLPPQQPFYAAITRENHQNITYPMSSVHFDFLAALQQGASVGAAIEIISEKYQRSKTDVMRSWQTDVKAIWIKAGFLKSRKGNE